jgi:hypothetical protein
LDKRRACEGIVVKTEIQALADWASGIRIAVYVPSARLSPVIATRSEELVFGKLGCVGWGLNVLAEAAAARATTNAPIHSDLYGSAISQARRPSRFPMRFCRSFPRDLG